MRWSNLATEFDEHARLPGYKEDAVVRHFDAPEAIETTFYEVRAKSILNQVPPASRMPFRWTINPYRGCSHACAYCLDGETPVLLAGGRHKPIAELEIGEGIYGTARGETDRRYVRTVVLDKWVTVKPAYRVALEDGTELIASGDHRFLSDRGWKHVVNTPPGEPDRPHLTTDNHLVGTGAPAPLAAESPGYRRGYLSGIVRADDLIGWPARPSLDSCRGWLAGTFDAAGSRGESEHLRFPHVTDPATTRKRAIDGELVTTLANLKVVEIERLGRVLPLYDITTGTGDFIANGVVSHNCFARPTHTYLDFNAGRDFEREIVVKVNAPELVRAELARRSWKGEHVALGTNTDPYQWVEGRYKLMQGIWEAMRDARNPCSVLTKSPLLLRDLALMKQISERTEFSAALSVPTLDERAWRATEPHTPNPRARLEAVAELTRAGIRTGVLIAPLMPGINDAPEQVAKILEFASEAGASYVTGIALHLRGEVRGLFLDWLAEHRPDLLPRYRQLYRRGAYVPSRERERLAALVSGPDLEPGQRMRGRTFDPEPRPAAEPETPDQPSLF